MKCDRTDCFAYINNRPQYIVFANHCTVLNQVPKDCAKCKFFKTVEQYEADKKVNLWY